MKEPIIGIDLGTTNSCAGIMRENNVEIIPDNEGKRILPSIICYKDNEWLYGKLAKDNMIEFGESTILESKRLIGIKYSNNNIQKDIKNWVVKIIEDSKTKKPQYVIKEENEEKKYFPEEVLSMILNHIKEYSEKYENNTIKKAIITVPDYFNNNQRKEIIKSAELIGLEVIKIINEPTAVAIAYSDIINKDKNNKKLLIFDIGGINFKATILEIKNNEYYILSSCNKSHLGGEDFNKRLEEYIIQEINKKDEFKNINFKNRNDKKILKAFKRIKNKIEDVKIELTKQENSSFFIDSLYNDEDFKINIERSKYEELCIDLWKQYFIQIDKILNIAKLNKNDIDDIILVGGSVRTPKIKQMIEEYFQKKPLQNINVDEVIAQGASLIPYFGKNIHENNEFLKSAQLHEITNLSIGIEVAYNQMKIIIPKGTLLPSSDNKIFKQSFQPQNKNIKDINVKIYEGEDDFVWGNHLLGRFKIKDLKKGNNIIDIEMILDHNSILTVVAKVNGKKIESLVITKNDFYDEEEAQNFETKTDWIKNARKKINNDNKGGVDD